MRAGVVEPCVSLARAEAAEISKGARWDASRTWRLIHARSPTAHHPAPPSTGAATLLCQLVLTEAEGGARGVKMHVEVRLQVLAAMAMSQSDEAHSVSAMGLATVCNAPDVNASLVAKIALPALVRLGRSPKADTQCAALDALSVLGELPQVQQQLDLARGRVT